MRNEPLDGSTAGAVVLLRHAERSDSKAARSRKRRSHHTGKLMHVARQNPLQHQLKYRQAIS
jgi:hypothetical protein